MKFIIIIVKDLDIRQSRRFVHQIILVLMMILWAFTFLEAQTYSFRHFTERDGLPTRYFYALDQGIDGRIWLSGEAGLLWTNGVTYELADIQPDLNDEAIRLYRDDHLSMWIQDLAGRISLYRDNELREFKEITPHRVYDYLTVMSFEGNVWIANTDDVFEYNYVQDTLYPKNVKAPEKAMDSRKIFHVDQKGNLKLLTQKGYFNFTEDKNQYFPYKNDLRFDPKSALFNLKDETYVFNENEVLLFRDSQFVIAQEFQTVIDKITGIAIDIKEDVNDNIWVSARNGLILIEPLSESGFEISQHLKGEVMGEILEDFEKNLWFTTSQNGIYKLATTQVKVFEDDGLDKQLRFVKQSLKGELVLGFDDNRFLVLDSAFQVIHDEKLFEENYRLYDYSYDKQGNSYAITANGYVKFNSKFKRIGNSSPWSLKAGAFTPNGSLWLGGGEFVGIDRWGERPVNLLAKRAYSIYPVSDQEVWIGTIDGPYLFKNGSYLSIDNPALQTDIRDIEMLDNGHLCFATQNDGLFIYDFLSDSIVHHLNTDNGLSSNYCADVLVDEKYIWLATKRGVNRISKSDYFNTVIGLDQGLPSNEVNYIHKTGKQFFLATNKGLVTFKEDIAVYNKSPFIQFSNVRISEKDTTLQEFYELRHNDNNIKVDFSGVTFKNADRLIYEYKMEGLDKTWISSAIGLAQYPSLPSGKYTFLVRAKTNNTIWSEPISMEFLVRTPFWRTKLFYLLASIFVLGSLYLIFRDIKRRGKTAKDIKASQLTALRSQMNPHFVFNALNSIQEFIIYKDTRSANRYLSQFAKLMRNVLNVSDRNKISLNKEIESLRLYLSLEALRFGDNFEYSFEIEEGLPVDSLFLPPMLVQPFVENAVKHGLMHKESMKKLYIRFHTKNSYLVCEIEDNGIGRAKSAEIHKNNPRIYTSKATSLTKERLKLLNSIFKNALSVQIFDLVDNDLAVGTKVIIKVHTGLN